MTRGRCRIDSWYQIAAIVAPGCRILRHRGILVGIASRERRQSFDQSRDQVIRSPSRFLTPVKRLPEIGEFGAELHEERGLIRQRMRRFRVGR